MTNTAMLESASPHTKPFAQRFATEKVDPKNISEVLAAVQHAFQRELDLCRNFRALASLDATPLPGEDFLPRKDCRINFYLSHSPLGQTPPLNSPVKMQIVTSLLYDHPEAVKMSALASAYVNKLVASAGGIAKYEWLEGSDHKPFRKVSTDITSTQLLTALQAHQKETGLAVTEAAGVGKSKPN